MANRNDSLDEEQPELDPAAERIRRKLTGLLFGSITVMVLGLVAVFSAILYKVGSEGDKAESAAPAAASASGETARGRIALPAGSQVVSTDLDGDRALLHLRNADGGEALALVDLLSGRILSIQEIGAE